MYWDAREKKRVTNNNNKQKRRKTIKQTTLATDYKHSKSWKNENLYKNFYCMQLSLAVSMLFFDFLRKERQQNLVKL